MEPCVRGCPTDTTSHCEVLCPSSSTCYGAPNTRDEHDCFVCCCFPIHLLTYILTTPFCICNMICSKTRPESTSPTITATTH